MLAELVPSRDRLWEIDASRRSAYRIRTCAGVFDPANPALARIGEDRERRLVVVDAGLPAATAARIPPYFAAFGIAARIETIAGGEGSKDLPTLLHLLDRFQDFALNRTTQPVVAVGGGAVLDVVGCAASLFRRGVPYVRIPTTLLAYVDASVGIKTGINLREAKNLIGAFAPPREVLLDAGFIATQAPAEIASGLGEVLKLGVGCHRALFEHLSRAARRLGSSDLPSYLRTDDFARLLVRSVDVMLDELSPNLYEDDLCRAVDLGHTFSLALELHPDRPLRHGEAVAVDVVLSCILSAARGLLGWDDARAVVDVARALELPLALDHVCPERLWRSACERTLHRGGRQRIPLPSPLGRCLFVNDLTPDELARAVAAFRSLTARER